MKIFSLILLTGFLFFCLVDASGARPRGVQVSPRGQDFFKTEPKTLVTGTIEIRNTSDIALEFVPDVTLPPGWNLITPSFPFRLAPNGTETRQVSFFIPETAMAGKYEITYQIKSSRYPSIRGLSRIVVAVFPITKRPAKRLNAPKPILVVAEKVESQVKSPLARVSRKMGVVDRFYGIPTIITISTAFKRDEEKKSWLQDDFPGGSLLDEDKDQQVAFLFRGPDTHEDPSKDGMDLGPFHKKNDVETSHLVDASKARQRGVQVSPQGQDFFQSEPKNVVTTTVEVRNTSDKALEFDSDVTVPEGWKLITPSFPFHLAPGGTEIRLISFFIPGTAMAGKYEILYQIRSSRYPSIRDLSRIFVEVLTVTKLQAKLLKAPEYVVAGDDYDALFSIINQSNTVQTVTLNVQSGQDLICRVEPENLRLAPGESKTVKVVVKTDDKITRGFKHFLNLTVHATGDETVKAQAKSAVTIISRITGVVDRFHRIPTIITFSTAFQTGEQKERMLQGEISGKGSLDEEGEKQIAFLFRGPDTLDSSSTFGRRDRYVVDYKSKTLDVGLGDHYYALSRLTEQSIDGRGIDSRLRAGDFEFRAYHMQTRQIDLEEQETAFQVTYPFNERYKMGLNLLNKKNDVENNQIASLQGKFEPFKTISLEFEAAYGKDDRSHDTAYWLDLYASPEWGGSYRLEYIYAAPDFPGYYWDKEYISGTFFSPITMGLTLNASFRQEKNNLDLDPELESAALSRYGQLGLDYKFKTGTTLSLESRYQTREDRLAEPDFDEIESGFRARLGHSFQTLSMTVSVEQKRITDRLASHTADVGIYEGYCYFMPTHNQTYGGYVRYNTYGAPESNGQDILNTGLSASFKIARRAGLKVKIDRTHSMAGDSNDRHVFDLALDYQFLNASRISAYGRHTLYGNNADQEDETAFIINYTIPFGMPVGQKKSVGMLEGHVLDQETGQPISDVILRLNGVNAVTNATGKFTFPALKPGAFYLDIDSASIGLGLVPLQKTPLKIDIVGGKTKPVEIGITKSAHLKGRIIRYDFAGKDSLQKGFRINKDKNKATGEADKDKLVEGQGLKNALLELKSKLETWRVLSDRKGRFRFSDLRPGQWTLNVYADNLPEYHYLEKNSVEVDLMPGDGKELLIRVLPKIRTIRMMDPGEVLIEEEVN